MDYYERVLYNQIIGSVNPHKYQTTYQYAVGLNASKPWGNETPQASCCGGTGVENHVKYQEAAYFVNDSTLWIALYMPTTAYWKQKDVTIKQECEWPAERSVIRIAKGKGKFCMKLRMPYWATDGFTVKINGKVVATQCKPCSYVEIPARKWTKKDVVEVTMPFTRHIDFGPDKMMPMWTGAFMNGPLVMAATGIKTWDEATVDVDADISNFIPDYAGDSHLTHYFRLNIPASPLRAGDDSIRAIDKSQLRELLLIAKSRSEEQQAWNALTVKVPEYAPWAAHGFARMEQQYAQAQPYFDAPADRYKQEEIDNVASALNSVINAMRPGNLPELEDLDELQQLLEKAKQLSDDDEKANRAISYAGMVIRYVSDGSGTMDMIQRATNQLKEVLLLQKE